MTLTVCSLLLTLFYALLGVDNAMYNLINAVPACYKKEICNDYVELGTASAIYPNSEERTTFLFRNVARLCPNAYISSKYGKYLRGTHGSMTAFYPDNMCGTAASNPYFYDSELNELARFHAFDALNCNEPIGHRTCPSQCSKFNGDCSLNARANGFVSNNIDSNIVIEDTWNGNIGFAANSFCSSIFNPNYNYLAIGIAANQNINFVNTIYAKLDNKAPPSYPLIHGSHFDERTKINRDDYNPNGQHLVFFVQYFGNVIDGKAALNVYLLYDGNVHAMDRVFGDNLNGFYAFNAAIDTKVSCKPYAFFVMTENFELFRLPEDEHYFFSTSMINAVDAAPCEINHFYNAKGEAFWTENGFVNAEKAENKDCAGCIESNVLSKRFEHFINMELAADISTLRPSASPTKSPILMRVERNEELLCCHGTKRIFERFCSFREYDVCGWSSICVWNENDCRHIANKLINSANWRQARTERKWKGSESGSSDDESAQSSSD